MLDISKGSFVAIRKHRHVFFGSHSLFSALWKSFQSVKNHFATSMKGEKNAFLDNWQIKNYPARNNELYPESDVLSVQANTLVACFAI